MSVPVPEDAKQLLYAAMRNSDLSAIRAIISANPSITHDSAVAAPSWLHYACKKSSKEIIDYLISVGMNINLQKRPGDDVPLTYAIDGSRPEIVEHLLKLGADPNLDRTLIAAVNLDDNSLKIIELLVEYGADVNKCFPFGDDDGPLMSPLEWAIDSEKEDIVSFLKSKGAKIEKGASDRDSSASKVRLDDNLEKQIVDHMKL
jgi:ankyrin repeat protein